MKNTCIILAGPTAVGKTDLGIRIAQHFDTKIISADSRQCFKELTIGVAKPSPSQLEQVQHYFMSSHSITENVNAAVFETYALQHADAIFQQNRVAVMVGGTGLYIKTFCEGIDEVPVIEEGLRERITAGYEVNGLQWLQDQVQTHDRLYYNKGEIKNPHRLMRALEVVLSTNRSILSFQIKRPAVRDFDIIKIGLELPRTELYDRINKRVHQMIREGLVAEAEQLLPQRQLNALQTVGYRELFSYFDGMISIPSAIEAIQTNTRHYAKRQMTWFKKDAAMHWSAPDFDEVLNLLRQQGLQ